MIFFPLLNIMFAELENELNWKLIDFQTQDLQTKYTLFKFDIFYGPEIIRFNNPEAQNFINVYFKYLKGFKRLYHNIGKIYTTDLYYNDEKSVKSQDLAISLGLKFLILLKGDKKTISKNILPTKCCLKRDYDKFKSSSDAITLIMDKYPFLGSTRCEYISHLTRTLQSVIYDLFEVEIVIQEESLFDGSTNIYYQLLDEILLPYQIFSNSDISLINHLL